MTELIMLIYLAAASAHVSPHIAVAIAMTESNLNPHAVGTKGDIGLFQVRHALVKESEEELKHPKTNTQAALRIMRNAIRGCGGLYGDGWVVCYNRGVVGGKRLVDYTGDSYYRKVMRRASCLRRHSVINASVVKGCY